MEQQAETVMEGVQAGACAEGVDARKGAEKKAFAMPELTTKDQVVETVKAAVLGAAMGFIMSWLVATFVMAFPIDPAENAMNNAMSGLISGLYGGLWGMVMFFVTMHLRQRKQKKQS